MTGDLAVRRMAAAAVLLVAAIATDRAPAPGTQLHHLLTTDAEGRQAWHTVHGDAARDQISAFARERGLQMRESEPADLSAAPKALQKLHAHALANGWDVSHYVGHTSRALPEFGGPGPSSTIHVVTARNLDTGTEVRQSYTGGKRDTYNAKPLSASMQAITDNPRSQMAAAGQESL